MFYSSRLKSLEKYFYATCITLFFLFFSSPDLAYGISLAPQTSSSEPASQSWPEKAWGDPAPATLYLGMVTMHLNPESNEENWNNQLIAVSYKDYFAGTLLNSYHDRAYAAGIEREWFTHEISTNVEGRLGYRLGLITGYDARMIWFANDLPALPFAQIIYDMTWHKHFGLEVSYGGIIVSASLFYQF